MALEVKILTSVGSVITEDGMVYPLKLNNEPDTDNGTHITECSDEWWDNLSNEDYSLVMNCGENEYSDEELMELEFIHNYESGSLDTLDF